jgi:hypothetical protein
VIIAAIASVGKCLQFVAKKHGFPSAADFNDDPKTTHKMMLNFLEEAKYYALHPEKMS